MDDAYETRTLRTAIEALTNALEQGVVDIDDQSLINALESAASKLVGPEVPSRYDILELTKGIAELTSQVEGLTRIIEGWAPDDSVASAIDKVVAEVPGRHRKDE